MDESDNYLNLSILFYKNDTSVLQNIFIHYWSELHKQAILCTSLSIWESSKVVKGTEFWKHEKLGKQKC